MLSKIVIKIYPILLEVALWLILLVGLVGGWQAGGFLAAVGGLIGAAIFGTVVFGAFLVLDDIRKKLASIESRK